MIINSEYDAWAIPNLLRIPCLKNGTSGLTLSECSDTEMKYIEKYRASFVTNISSLVYYLLEIS